MKVKADYVGNIVIRRAIAKLIHNKKTVTMCKLRQDLTTTYDIHIFVLLWTQFKSLYKITKF